MSTMITVLHVITCLFLMLTVLLQSGKGGGMGGAFGGSNAGTVFGGSGASTFLAKLTAGASTVFMLTSIVLAFIASRNSADGLQSFGEAEAKKAAEKRAAKKAAEQLEQSGSGSADGASMMLPGSGTTPETPPGSDGSAVESGSAAPEAPEAAPTPAPAEPAAPAPTPAGSAAP